MILDLPELSGDDWDTYSMVAEVTDGSVAVTGYRYAENGPPVSTEVPDCDDALWELRGLSRTSGEAPWDIVLAKVERGSSRVVINFVGGQGAALWRVTPDNIERLPEALRPRREDFLAD